MKAFGDITIKGNLTARFAIFFLYIYILPCLQTEEEKKHKLTDM